MNRSFKNILLVTLAMFASLAANVQADDRSSLSSRVRGSQKGVKFKKPAPKYRTNDSGKSLKGWCQQVAYRAQNDTFIYRSQGKATTRHEEVSSQAIIFHLKDGQVRPGHVYQMRGN